MKNKMRQVKNEKRLMKKEKKQMGNKKGYMKSQKKEKENERRQMKNDKRYRFMKNGESGRLNKAWLADARGVDMF